jgi:hypothetical protein
MCCSPYVSVSVVSTNCEYVTEVSISHIRNLIMNVQQEKYKIQISLGA